MSGLTELTEYKCESCGWTFDLNIYGWKGTPNNCPCCGELWKVKRTPADIVYAIKSTNSYNYSNNQERKVIDELLNELRELVEK